MNCSYFLFLFSGTLIIQTEDTQWNYEVRGSYPDATINTAAIRSKVDCYRGNGGLSPSSLKLTLAQLQRGKPLNLAGCLQMVIINYFSISDYY